MLKQLYKRRDESGFTIIEVMIVLAIAALILLIVLLAVPALQRNSRNTTVKNDVSSIAGAINTYESDYNGTPPTNISGTGTITLATGANCSGATNPETISVNGSTKVTCITTAPAANPAAGTVQVELGFSCPANPALGTNGAASTRAFSLWYVTEASSGNILQCESS